jgi:hypothetical protein
MPPQVFPYLDSVKTGKNGSRMLSGYKICVCPHRRERSRSVLRKYDPTMIYSLMKGDDHFIYLFDETHCTVGNLLTKLTMPDAIVTRKEEGRDFLKHKNLSCFCLFHLRLVNDRQSCRPNNNLPNIRQPIIR